MTTLTTLDILKKGRELIADPARWTQGAFARNKWDDRCDPSSNYAKCFCCAGALIAVSGLNEIEAFESGALAALEVAAGKNGKRADLASYNDSHSHDLIVALWDRAIAAEEAKQ